MSKRSSAKKKRSTQEALVCGEAFQRLAKEIIPKIGAIKEKSSQAMSAELGDVVACATTLGFAIELYIKALLTQLDLPFPQTHDLRNLYDLLPKTVRKIIESTYNEALPEQVRLLYGRMSITIAKGPLEEPEWDDNNKISLSLPDVLARSRDIFQSWRYIYEFTQPENSPYKFHQFEYGFLWSVAESIRVESTVRLHGTENRT